MNKLQKTMLLTAMLCLTATADAKKKTIVKECWPNGETIAEWFRDTTKVDVGQLGKRYVLTDYGVRQGTNEIQTKAIQRVIDRAAKERGGSAQGHLLQR